MVNRIRIVVNRILGAFDFTVQRKSDLLERWREGLQLDYHRLYGFVNESAHQEVEMNFVARSGG